MSSSHTAAVTSLDVLENFFCDVPTEEQILSLSDSSLEELHDRVMEFSSTEEPEPVPDDSIYPGSWIAGNWQMDAIRPDLNQSLIYHNSIVTHDPVADFFGMSERWLPSFRNIRSADGTTTLHRDPSLWTRDRIYESLRSDPDRARQFLAGLIPYLFELSPMIKSRVIIPRPQWKTFRERRDAMMTSARHDVKNPAMRDGAPQVSAEFGPIALWDQLHGLRAELTQKVNESDQRWDWEVEFFQLAKQLAFSDQYETVYVPHHRGDLELLKLKLGTLNQAQQNQPTASVLDEVNRVVLPNLNLSARTAVAIRKDDESFEAWRRTIRSINRDAVNDDHSTLRQRVEDELTTVKEQIERQAFGSSLKEHVTRGGLAAAFTSVSQVALEQILTGSTNPTLTLGAGAIGWMSAMFVFPRARGAGRVMVSLQKSEQIPDDIARRRGIEPR